MTYSPNFRGNAANAASRQLQTDYVNGAGGTISKGTPVSTNAAGNIVLLDVSDETKVSAMVGLASQDIPDTASGTVVSGGRLENITTSFAVGDPVYVGLSGSLINQKPDIGVAGFTSGDFVVFVGVVVKNEFNPANKDIQLMLQLVGQL